MKNRTKQQKKNKNKKFTTVVVNLVSQDSSFSEACFLLLTQSFVRFSRHAHNEM